MLQKLLAGESNEKNTNERFLTELDKCDQKFKRSIFGQRQQ